jgi:hypothetical protein
MGYTTDFFGILTLSRTATNEEVDYINKISGTRRMKRDVKKLFRLYDGKHGNPFAKTREEIYGNEGEYFVGGQGSYGQENDKSVIDHNLPPGQNNWSCNVENGQPGLWCQWILSSDGTTLEWDGGEKFYNYVEWLQYLIKHFFEPWGIKLIGEITWNGEDREDIGKIVVDENNVTVLNGKITFV